MTLKLRNLNKSLEYKVNKCIALLGDEYRSLDYTIDFYKNKQRLEQERKNNPEMNDEQYTQILSGKISTSGITIADKKKIKIFLFLFGKNLVGTPDEIIHFIGNIYHELRHARQATDHLYENEPEVITVDGSFEEYLKLPSEKDAYIFQEQQMDKHLSAILDIFGFKVNRGDVPFKLKEDIRKIIYA